NVGVTKVRIANEDGNWSAWLDYAAAKSWTLTPFAMTKGVFMQVRDAAGNESNVQFQTTLCTPCLLTPRVLAALKHKPQVTIMRARRGTLRADRIMPSARAQHFDLSQLDHRRDVLDCGAGRDTALVRPEDVTRHCEHVVVVHDPKV
ncbi:MAG: hypothetical protein JWN41_1684, partial [Thermoleophilia bacterium]|nr:hypothetical protein [Thermoleophilia bacterium]